MNRDPDHDHDEWLPPELEYDPTMDRDYPPAKEEPDCGGCNDSGEVLIVRPGRAARYRRCRSCDPTRRDRAWAAVHRFARSLRDGFAAGRTGDDQRSDDRYDDEPPF